MSAHEGLLLKVTHLGTIVQELHLHDIIDGPLDPYYRSAGPVYLNPNTYVILDYTTAVALSFESGVIRGYIIEGYVSAEFMFGGPLATAIGSVVTPGDIPETYFSANNNQIIPEDITAFSFDTAMIRSFQALVSVAIDATAPVFAVYTLRAVQRVANWSLSTSRTGDATGFVFSITPAGQIQYTSTNMVGWVETDVVFRAITTGV